MREFAREEGARFGHLYTFFLRRNPRPVKFCGGVSSSPNFNLTFASALPRQVHNVYKVTGRWLSAGSMDMTVPISRLTRQQEVTNRLREMVLSGALLPGTRLQEVALAEIFGVSRTPLRAALTVLREEGLLTYQPNRGFEIRRIVVDDILASYDVRGTLEGMACRLCAERGLGEEASRGLIVSLEDGDAISTSRLSDEEAFLRWRQINARFHDTLLTVANNPCLRDVTERTMKFPFVSHWVGRWSDPQRYRLPQQMHHAIYEAIVQREAARAEALMREHVYQAKAMVRTFLSNLADMDSEKSFALAAIASSKKSEERSGLVQRDAEFQGGRTDTEQV
jgi:GntR family transcriptional regulator, vanillate catabolism transcriptional regulator